MKLFKKLPIGMYRLVVVFWFLISIAIGLYGADQKSDGSAVLAFSVLFSISFIVYYALAILFVWIYLGFKEKE